MSELSEEKAYINHLKYEINALNLENSKLQQRIDIYENPEDLTLFYMWLDEKAKDKMKRLNDNWNELKEWLEEENKKTFIDIVSISAYQRILSKMQEIEKGNKNDK